MRVHLSRGVALTFVLMASAPLSARGQLATTATNIAGRTVVRGPVGGEDIIRTARQYLGVRYRLGGTTPDAFDCSGFIGYVFAQHGITLPRTAKQQAALGVAPFPGDLKPGDLLFFYGGRGAQHIAMYVGGDTIIHASSSARRVRLDVLSRSSKRKNWFRQRLIAVRRVLPLNGVYYVPGTGSTGAAAASPTSDSSEETAAKLPRHVGPQPESD
jgi:cell wall-associated NlpC family hydrolase